MSKVCSIFSQMLQLISRTGFEAAVRKHQAERHARGFSSWGQFKLRHLGLPQAPPRSTLAYANQHRPWQLYEEVFHQLLTRCQGLAMQQSGGRRKFRFKHKLLSMDATVIDLCASVFDWARFCRTTARSNCICCCGRLFVYRDLWLWIDRPFQAPEPLPAVPRQLAMAWQ